MSVDLFNVYCVYCKLPVTGLKTRHHPTCKAEIESFNLKKPNYFSIHVFNNLINDMSISDLSSIYHLISHNRYYDTQYLDLTEKNYFKTMKSLKKYNKNKDGRISLQFEEFDNDFVIVTMLKI